ncbi:MAG: low molecular weight protein-tyrosine-phosphatase [Cyclobacteriaceae bacterium]
MKKLQKKILFVCLGNICRSPLAEAIFNKRVRDMGLEGQLIADSCGTGSYHIGERPDPRTLASAAKYGIPVSHLCRQLHENDFTEFDMILAMDESNKKNILWKGGEPFSKKVWLMRAFDPHGGEQVPDPYHGRESEFEEVYQILDRSVSGLIRYLKKEILTDEQGSEA